MMSTRTSDSVVYDDDMQYDRFLKTVSTNFDRATRGAPPIFTTEDVNPFAEPLFSIFLRLLPSARRQHYTCRTCRKFIDKFGGLIIISDSGFPESIFWNNPAVYPPFFFEAVQGMLRAIMRTKVTGVFLSDEPVWGTSSNVIDKPPFKWWHMAVTPPNEMIFRPATLSAEQAIAEKSQEFEMLGRGLAEFPLDVVRQAHSLLLSGNLYRSEKCVSGAAWLMELQEARRGHSGRTNDNLIWRAVAMAPSGFAHVKSSMIGTLLDDIKAKKPFDVIKRNFDEKMDPTRYQRPQVAPAAGNIVQAEKLVETLKTAGALARRFARLEDLQALWMPRPTKQQSVGIFANLKPKGVPVVRQMNQPPVTMTWEKFRRTVLPTADNIEFYVPGGNSSYAGLITAANPKAPLILQWDNPVSWYFYSNLSSPTQWNLRASSYRRVTAITLQPSMWRNEDAFIHQGAKVFFILDGARDTAYVRGAGFFPEMLRSEYHGVRATMEAFAQSAVVAGASAATACGIGLQKDKAWDFTFKVDSKGMSTTYKLDRWD